MAEEVFAQRENYKYTTLPSLDDSSWLNANNNPLIVGNKLFAHLLASDFSQTYLYPGEVTSLAYIIDRNKDDLRGLIEDLQDSLTKYYNRYFDGVETEVTEVSNEDKNTVSLSIYIEYVGNDKVRYNLGQAIYLVDGVLRKVININNYGTES